MKRYEYIILTTNPINLMHSSLNYLIFHKIFTNIELSIQLLAISLTEYVYIFIEYIQTFTE